jgi:hypothetical protein
MQSSLARTIRPLFLEFVIGSVCVAPSAGAQTANSQAKANDTTTELGAAH